MIIADTGFWVALANRCDAHHGAAVAALESVSESLITTWPVLTETCRLLLARLGPDAQERFLAGIAKGASQVFQLEPSHLPRIKKLMRKYRELPMDLADASLVVVAERLGVRRVLTLDRRRFDTYRVRRGHRHLPFRVVRC